MNLSPIEKILKELAENGWCFLGHGVHVPVTLEHAGETWVAHITIERPIKYSQDGKLERYFPLAKNLREVHKNNPFLFEPEVKRGEKRAQTKSLESKRKPH